MSKQPPPKVAPVVEIVASEKARVTPSDTYDVGPVTVPFRIRRGNNEYDLVDVTFATPVKIVVRRARTSRMEVDYELKAEMMRLLGPNRFGPSGDE